MNSQNRTLLSNQKNDLNSLYSTVIGKEKYTSFSKEHSPLTRHKTQLFRDIPLSYHLSTIYKDVQRVTRITKDIGYNYSNSHLFYTLTTLFYFSLLILWFNNSNSCWALLLSFHLQKNHKAPRIHFPFLQKPSLPWSTISLIVIQYIQSTQPKPRWKVYPKKWTGQPNKPMVWRGPQFWPPKHI